MQYILDKRIFMRYNELVSLSCVRFEYWQNG